MCGIAGVLLRHAPLAEEPGLLRRALDQIRHRGPDGEGLWTGDGLVLGHCRLAILDLSDRGLQPMHTPDGRFTCVLNGEIYNYIELRSVLERSGHTFRSGTDTEVLLAAFASWGSEAVRRFRGQFAFAVWDSRARRLWLGRDRAGEKPLYYRRTGDRLVFASEMKAILELEPARPALAPAQVDVFLHYQYTLEPDTLVDGVHKLPAGHLLEITPDDWQASPRAYWSISSIEPVGGDPVPRLRETLEEAVALTLRSDAPVGLSLSGGLDSGIVAALAARQRPALQAFTVGYPGAPAFDERAAARGIADHLGLRWHAEEISTGEFSDAFPRFVELLDEPIADVAGYAQYRVSRLAAAHGIKVLLTGIGGDEILFGYEWVREALRLSRLKRRLRGSAVARGWGRLLSALLTTRVPGLLANHRFPIWWQRIAGRAFDPGRLDLQHPDEWVFYQLDYHWQPAEAFTRRLYAGGLTAGIPPRGPHRFMAGMEEGDARVALIDLLFRSWLVSNCLNLGDRVSMASAVETRVPLLDVEVVETVVGAWRAVLDEPSGHKSWLRAAGADLLPQEVLARRKLGFVPPTLAWIEAVNTRYQPALLDGLLIAEGILDPDALRGWLNRPDPGVPRAFFQYKLTMLEFWCRMVLRRERQGAPPVPA